MSESTCIIKSVNFKCISPLKSFSDTPSLGAAHINWKKIAISSSVFNIKRGVTSEVSKLRIDFNMIISIILNVIIILLALYKFHCYMFYRPPNFPPG